jgi:subtilisin-like proprotein convertase family protein
VTTATLTITTADTNDVADYACMVVGGCGSVTSSNATLGLAVPGVVNFSVNRPIPDGSFIGISDTRTVATPFQAVSVLKVQLKIVGTYNGDLFCYLTHGSGYSVLLNRVGRTASDGFGYDDPGVDVTFYDGAINDVHIYRLVVTGNPTTPVGTNLIGSWVGDGRTNRPTEVLDTDARPALLNSFTGLDPNGNWTIFVADLSGGDSHTLVSWGLEISGSEAPPVAGTISGKVQLQGFTGTGPRTVQFVASDSTGVGLQTNDVSLTFAGSPKVADYMLSVPTNTAYVSAKTVWNLRRRQGVTFVSGVATNNFTSTGGQLLGGDISQNNNLVNTADYTVLKGNWLKSTDTADITGDGLVNTADYTVLKGNWLKTGDPQ